MENKKKRLTGLPPKQGLYDPAFEHDACGVGFIVDIHGRKSHAIVKDALTILLNLDHRGAVGAEHNTGDGAGILTQMPDKFLRRVCAEQGIHLPELGKYGAGVVFSSPEEAEAKAAQETFEKVAAEQGLAVLGWRELAVDNSMLGATALASEPRMRQVFIERKAGCTDILDFERQLFIIRKRAHHAIRGAEPNLGVADVLARGGVEDASLHRAGRGLREAIGGGEGGEHEGRQDADGQKEADGGSHGVRGCFDGRNWTMTGWQPAHLRRACGGQPPQAFCTLCWLTPVSRWIWPASRRLGGGWRRGGDSNPR